MQKADFLKQLGLPFMQAEQQSDDDDGDEDEMDEEKKHQNWVANRAYLYDHLIVHSLSAPTSSVQWLPKIDDMTVNKKNYLVTGTADSENPQKNFIAVYSVQLPKFKPTIDVANEARAPPKEDDAVEKRHSVKLEKKLPHQGEVNRLAYMPQESDIIATKTDQGTVNLFRLDSSEGTGPFSVLKGLTAAGFGLSWSTKDAGHLVSSGADGKIAIWDALKSPEQPVIHIKEYTTSVNVRSILYTRMSSSILKMKE